MTSSTRPGSSTTVSVPEPASSVSGGAPAGLRAELGRFGWPLLCLFELGLVLAAFYFGTHLVPPGPHPKAPVPNRPGPQAEQVPPDSISLPHAPREHDLEEVDHLIRCGRYELALGVCRSAAAGVAGLRDAFLYRRALCEEGLGRWDSALQTYRLVASHGGSARITAAAQLGQARVWLRMSRPGESKGLLYELLLRSAQPGLGGLSLLVEARFLLALAVVEEASRPQQAGLLDDTPVGQAASDWPLEQALAWGQPESGPNALALPAAEDRIVVRRGTSHEADQVTIAAHSTPVATLFDQIASQMGVQLEWSAAARQQVEDHNLRIEVEQMALPDLLWAVCGMMGLDWQLTASRLALSSDQEEPDSTAGRRMRAARRVLRSAIAAHPRHLLTPAAYLELGNLEVAANQANEGAVWYQRLSREWPRSSLVIAAQYNLGLLHQRAGSWSEARQALYRVVDRAPAHELAPHAYWRIGRIHLDEGHAEQAVSPLRRALATSAGNPVAGAAALNLAAAYLLTGNPQAANALLLEHRSQVREPEYQLLAAFLDALARFRTCTDRRRQQREATDLLTCMFNLGEDPILGPAGLLLLGQAYHELGMNDSVVTLYEKSLPRLRGVLATEVSYLLAEAWYASDHLEKAAGIYARLADRPSGRWRNQALMRLVQISLELKQPRQCLRWCRVLLREKDGIDVVAVLRSMASAYELTGEHRQAIRCLSGEVPE